MFIIAKLTESFLQFLHGMISYNLILRFTGFASSNGSSMSSANGLLLRRESAAEWIVVEGLVAERLHFCAAFV